MADTTRAQIEITERLQLKWLTLIEQRMDEGSISPAEMATLERFLRNNGWNLDPSRLPQGLRDKLTSKINFDDDEESDGVLKLYGT